MSTIVQVPHRMRQAFEHSPTTTPRRLTAHLLDICGSKLLDPDLLDLQDLLLPMADIIGYIGYSPAGTAAPDEVRGSMQHAVAGLDRSQLGYVLSALEMGKHNISCGVMQDDFDRVRRELITAEVAMMLARAEKWQAPSRRSRAGSRR